jgi:hypothetical protein
MAGICRRTCVSNSYDSHSPLCTWMRGGYHIFHVTICSQLYSQSTHTKRKAFFDSKPFSVHVLSDDILWRSYVIVNCADAALYYTHSNNTYYDYFAVLFDARNLSVRPGTVTIRALPPATLWCLLFPRIFLYRLR